MSSENAIRSQVLVNGEVVTTAGYDGYGVLSAIITRVQRDPADWADATNRNHWLTES